MKLGKAWILTEVFFHTGRRSLVSILSARKTDNFVKDYLEQAYVDRYASIEEKLAYKNRRGAWPLSVTPIDPHYKRVLVCGHEPTMWACYCHRLSLRGDVLTYTYKTLKHVDEKLRPTFGEVTEEVVVEHDIGEA